MTSKIRFMSYHVNRIDEKMVLITTQIYINIIDYVSELWRRIARLSSWLKKSNGQGNNESPAELATWHPNHHLESYHCETTKSRNKKETSGLLTSPRLWNIVFVIAVIQYICCVIWPIRHSSRMRVNEGCCWWPVVYLAPGHRMSVAASHKRQSIMDQSLRSIFILTRMGQVNEPYTSGNWTTTGSVHGYSPVCQITVMMFTYHFEVAKLLWWMPGYVYVPPFEGGEIQPSRNGEEWMIIIDLGPASV